MYYVEMKVAKVAKHSRRKVAESCITSQATLAASGQVQDIGLSESD